MRNIVPLFFLFPAFTNAQGLVSQSPANRTVLLEEYTAINCGNCPAAHNVATTIFNAHPTNVVGVEVHGGGLSVPSGSQVDLRSSAGSALWSQYGVSFQPQGMVNRQGLQGASTWPNAVNAALASASPVNIGMATTFDPGTRGLTVDVELYYTADSPDNSDRIYVLLTEDHINGYQQDYVNGAHANYDHRLALRGYITALAGDDVTTTMAGTSVLRSYSFNVPTAWNIDQLAAVAFIGEQSVGSTPGVVYQVVSVAAAGGATSGMATLTDGALGQAFPQPASAIVTIPFVTLQMADVLQLRDASGRLIRSERITNGQQTLVFDASDLVEGVYYYGFAGSAARPLIVVH